MAGPTTSNGFFQAYFLSILENCFFILTDGKQNRLIGRSDSR